LTTDPGDVICSDLRDIASLLGTGLLSVTVFTLE
jgi:hypothetical protein